MRSIWMPVLHVVSALEQTMAGGVRAKTPKTSQGRRDVALPLAAIEVLRRHRIAQAEDCLRSGSGRPELLFPAEATDPRAFSKAFARLADRAGVDTTFHGLRHTHVTDLVNAGVNARTVSERAGHASVAFTLQRYFHTTSEMDRQAAQQLDGALRRALGWQTGSNGTGGGS
jgi:integrase